MHIWQVKSTADKDEDTWNTIPTYMWHSIDRELNLYKFTHASAPTSRKRRYAKDPHFMHIYTRSVIAMADLYLLCVTVWS